MKKVVGIRREDKNEWEKRTPLIPSDADWLREARGIQTIIQPSPIRIFPAADYEKAGAKVSEDISEAEVIFAVKEIPESFFFRRKTYVFFSHTIKGQPYNMPMLKKMVKLECNLIDYERIVDQQNRRLIFFGGYAGLAGMIETLEAFGEKLKLRGYNTPFVKVRHAYEYPGLMEAKREIEKIGDQIADKGFPAELAPLVVGFAGYGNVSRGAQEIFDLLPFKIVSPQVMREMSENFTADRYNIYKVVYKEEDLVRRKEGEFNLQEYYNHPERYDSTFQNDLPYLTILINGIYWTEKYPRLVTKEYLKTRHPIHANGKLLVIGDISCDIAGSIEITYKATKPDHPFFTYFPDRDAYEDRVHRLGVTVMAVDNLPCEFPREASAGFSSVLKNSIPDILNTDFNQPFAKLTLPYPLKKALILHHGRFTPEYEYMKEFIK